MDPQPSHHLIIPGSGGLPFERLPDGGTRNPAWAEYALVGWENGRLSVAFRRVLFDLDALIATAHASGMPHGEWWVVAGEVMIVGSCVSLAFQRRAGLTCV